MNNCAGATLLALAAVVASKGSEAPEVIVSRSADRDRGRIPNPWSAALSGARLREVGTTNRTRLSDFENAATKTPARSSGSTQATSRRSASRSR